MTHLTTAMTCEHNCRLNYGWVLCMHLWNIPHKVSIYASECVRRRPEMLQKQACHTRTSRVGMLHIPSIRKCHCVRTRGQLSVARFALWNNTNPEVLMALSFLTLLRLKRPGCYLKYLGWEVKPVLPVDLFVLVFIDWKWNVFRVWRYVIYCHFY